MAKKTSSALMLIGVFAFIIVAVLVYAVFFKTSQVASPNQAGTGAGGLPYISTGSTALTYAGADELTGTSVTVSPRTRVGETGAYVFGVTTASPGNKLYVLFNATGYHNTYSDTPFIVPQAPTMVNPVSMKANGTLSIAVFNVNDVIMTTTGSVNETAVSGAVYNQKIRLTGSSQKDTGDLRCILEASNGTAITKIELTGIPGATYVSSGKPQFYSLLGATSAVWVYDISPVVGAVTPTGNLVVTSATGKSAVLSSVKVTCYTKEYFVDTNTGTILHTIEDTSGAQQSINYGTFTYYFQ